MKQNETKSAKLAQVASEELEKRTTQLKNIEKKHAEAQEQISFLNGKKEEYANNADFDLYTATCEEIRRAQDVLVLCQQMKQGLYDHPAVTAERIDSFIADAKDAFEEDTADTWEKIRKTADTLETLVNEIDDKRSIVNTAIEKMHIAAGKKPLPFDVVTSHQMTIKSIRNAINTIRNSETVEVKGFKL